MKVAFTRTFSNHNIMSLFSIVFSRTYDQKSNRYLTSLFAFLPAFSYRHDLFITILN
jgi:hypothetical protein